MNWFKDAACKDAPLDIFFTHDIEDQKDVIETFCKSCPVREECLETYIGQHFGIFGGMTARQRETYRRRRYRRAA